MTPYSSSLSSKGQVTIPQEVRLRLGLQEGDRVEFVVEGERTLIRPARQPHNPFIAYVGALAGSFPGGVSEINTWVADLRDDALNASDSSVASKAQSRSAS